MNKIEFAKRCMETEWKVGLCDDLWCQTTCPYGISLAKGEIMCSNSSRKAWAEKVLAEQTQKELEEIREYRNSTGATLYPPSTFIATPALAEPRKEEEYEIETQQNVKLEQEKELEKPKKVICIVTEECLKTHDESVRRANDSTWIKESLNSSEIKEILNQEEPVTPKFEPKTRGGHEYVIYKIYSEEEGQRPFLIHGATKNKEGKWQYASWRLNGLFCNSTDERDLIPLKKRRFKTAEELVANRYGVIEFYCYGCITVRHDMMVYTRNRSDTPEGNYSKEWLDVFTVEENI